MSRALCVSLLLLPIVALAPSTAAAQDGGRKFDVKRLEKEFAPMPVFFKRGAVVQNEVIVSRDQVKDAVRAVYVVKVDSSKVLEFYKEQTSVDPVQKGEEILGDLRYTFILPAKEGDDRIYRVVVTPLGKNKAQVTLWHRAVTDSDEFEDE